MLREEILREPQYPVHKVADRLLPYLRILVEQFKPQQIILFGSYAFGQPKRDSDVDLLVIKRLHQSALKEAVSIRQAWWPIHKRSAPLAFDLLVTVEAGHKERLKHAAGFYDRIVARGVRLA